MKGGAPFSLTDAAPVSPADALGAGPVLPVMGHVKVAGFAVGKSVTS
jgi:hypothetical protein